MLSLSNKRRAHRPVISPLEARRLLATASLSGGQATFLCASYDLLIISRDSSGQLRHNRWSEGDAGFANNYDFSSSLPGTQTLFASATTKITEVGADGLELDDSLRSSGGSYWVYTDHLTLPDGTGFYYDNQAQRLRMQCGSGSDTIQVASTNPNIWQYVQLNGNGGADTFNIGANGTMDYIDTPLQALRLDGGAADDKVVYHDEITAASGTVYALSSDYFWRDGVEQLQTESIENMELRTTEQNDVITCTAGGGVKSVFVDANGGADVINAKAIPLAPYNSYKIDAAQGNDDINIIGTGPNKPIQVVSGSGNDTLDIAQPSGSAVNVQLDHSEQLASLSLDLDAHLSLAWGGTNTLIVDNAAKLKGFLDVGDNSVILKTPPALSEIRSQLSMGYAGGTWTGGSLGAINSTACAFSSARDGIGYASASEMNVSTYAGVAISGNDLVLTRTLMGDFNLDHLVDFADLLRLSQNYGSIDKHWSAGNFTFDSAGAVNFSDLLLLAQNYGTSLFSSAAIRRQKTDFPNDFLA